MYNKMLIYTQLTIFTKQNKKKINIFYKLGRVSCSLNAMIRIKKDDMKNKKHTLNLVSLCEKIYK